MLQVESALRRLDSLARASNRVASAAGNLTRSAGAVPECRLRGEIRATVEEAIEHLGYRLAKDAQPVKKRIPRRKFEFDRLEPGGTVALVQFNGELLEQEAGFGDVSMILDGLLEHKLQSAFVFTEGASIHQLYTDELLPSYLGDEYFRHVRGISKASLDALSAETLEDRAAQFKVWMSLPNIPPPDHDQEDTGFDQPPEVRKTIADALIEFGETASNGIVKASFGKLPHEIITKEEGFRGRLPKLVDWASRDQALEMLILHSLRYRPDHPDLIDVAERYELESTRMKRKDVDELIEKKGLNLPAEVFRERQGLMGARVCQVQIKKEPKGTGFLVADDLVLTNYHVVEALFEDQRLVPKLRFRFDYRMKPSGEELYDGRYVYAAEGDAWIVDRSAYHPDEARGFAADVVPAEDLLDYALIRLAEPVGGEPIAPEFADSNPKIRGSIELPESIETKAGDPVYILHHPAGNHLRMTLQSNGVIKLNDKKTRLLYRAGTMSGSSGSPCFSGEWELLALHSSGDTIFKHFNADGHEQGVPADKIRALLEKNGVPEFQ